MLSFSLILKYYHSFAKYYPEVDADNWDEEDVIETTQYSDFVLITDLIKLGRLKRLTNGSLENFLKLLEECNNLKKNRFLFIFRCR